MLERLKLIKDNFIENVQAGDKKARKWLIIFCGIALFLIIGLFALIKMNLGYRTFEVTAVIDKNDDVSVNYQVIGDGLIRYSKDGASYTDKNGKLVWNQTFEMSNAQVASRGDYMAIGDIGSNQMRIFNQVGQISVVNALYPLEGIQIAEQGVVAAVLADTNQHYIVLYDATGEELVKIKATISKTGYPVDIALSNDGTKLAVSYLVISEGDVTTRIVFYKFGKTSDNADYIAGTYAYDQIFPKVEFINNNTIVAFGEQGFEIYSMKDGQPEIVLEKVFDNDIKSIFYNEQYIGFVFRNEGAESMSETFMPETESQSESFIESEVPTVSENTLLNLSGAVDDAADPDGNLEGDAVAEESDMVESVSETVSGSSGDNDFTMPEGSPDGKETEMETSDGVYPSLNQPTAETAEGSGRSESNKYRYKMLVYTNAGKLYLDKEFNFDYHSIVCSNDEIILYNENECVMFEYNGKQKFEYTFDSRISGFLPKKTSNEYILIDDETIKEIKLK